MSYSLAYTQAIALLINIGAQIKYKQAEWVSASFLSGNLSIPRPTVVSIITKLLAAGLIESKEGNQGGVRLLRTPEQITLLDIFYAIEQKKPLFRVDMKTGQTAEEFKKAGQKVLNSFQAAEKNMKEALAKVSLDELFGCEG